MNILLTGGAGFIGSHTAVELLNAGHDVIIVDNLYNSSAKAVERVEELTGKRVKFYCADACDHDAMDRIFSENKVDAVIHFAAYKAVGESVAKPLEYYRNNLDCTLTVCEAMKKHDVKRFIFSSSATVYGIPDHMPLDETMPTSCTNPYGWTKYMNERILTDVAKANPCFCAISIRLVRMKAAVSAKCRTAFRTTCCRMSLRLRRASWPICMCLATTIRPRTERAFAIISMSSIWRVAMSRRPIMP